MPVFNAKIFIVLVTLVLESCSSCEKPEKRKAEADNKKEDAFVSLDANTLFKISENYSFKSRFEVLVKKGEDTQNTEEIVEIIGASPRILFNKKVDDFHFYSIFKDGENFLVQNQGGGFRKSDNKHLYQTLLDDGFNLTAWFVYQFALKDNIMTKENDQGGTLFLLKNVSIPMDAPFIKDLSNRRSSDFSHIDNASLSGTIKVDKQTSLPISASFDVTITRGQHLIKIKAVSALDITSAQNLALPTIREDEPIDVPVNMSKRFNELFELEKGKHR
jgi:hypothetical protein